MENTHHPKHADLQAYVMKVMGTNYEVSQVTRMHGGAQKVVYKINCSNGFSCVLYVWDITKNYFQEEIENGDLNNRSYGGDLFELNNKVLTGRGIRTPILYDMNKERSRYPFDYALVEYVDGPKAESFFQHPDLKVKEKVLQGIGEMLANMHAYEQLSYGKSDQLSAHIHKCHLLQLNNGIVGLDYASQYLDSIHCYADELRDTLTRLEARIEPRARYGLIHGELGPDHILINDKLEPYLIDIEGAEFFDVEHEHSFLQIRFGEYYRYLHNDNLDANRMLFYRFHHHLSLISAGLKLQHRGFPDQLFAQSLSDYHSRQALLLMEYLRE